MKKLLNKKGFTIVELVIVIAVIAILAAVLIPTFSNVIESANETATMQEAKNTLDSYIGVMTADGASLPDGTVFIVFDSEKAAEDNKILPEKQKVAGAFIFFKGSLHKFDYKSATKSLVDKPAEIKLGATQTENSFKLPKVNGEDTIADTYINWTDEQLKEFVSGNNFYFAYCQVKPVVFDGGSTKCKIYSGSIINKVSDITLSTTTTDVTIGEKNSGSQTYTIDNFDASAERTITFTATTTPAGSAVSYSVDKEASVATITQKGVLTIKANATGTITVTVTSGGHTVYVKINIKKA